jgi:hypothetical protein
MTFVVIRQDWGGIWKEASLKPQAYALGLHVGWKGGWKVLRGLEQRNQVQAPSISRWSTRFRSSSARNIGSSPGFLSGK